MSVIIDHSNDNSLGNESRENSHYWYSLDDGFRLVMWRREQCLDYSNSTIANAGEEYTAYRENNASIFVADPYRVDNFDAYLRDDVARITATDNFAAKTCWTRMPVKIIIPLLCSAHWRVITIDIDYDGRTARLLFDDPYGVGGFDDELKQVIKSSIKKSVQKLIRKHTGDEEFELKDDALETIEKKIDQQGRGKNSWDCGVIAFSNIKDYIVSREEPVYSIPCCTDPQHGNKIKEARESDALKIESVDDIDNLEKIKQHVTGPNQSQPTEKIGLLQEVELLSLLQNETIQPENGLNTINRISALLDNYFLHKATQLGLNSREDLTNIINNESNEESKEFVENKDDKEMDSLTSINTKQTEKLSIDEKRRIPGCLNNELGINEGDKFDHLTDEQVNDLLNNILGVDTDIDAFKTCLCLNNTNLMDVFVKHRVNSTMSQRMLEECLSQAYEELKTTNVPISARMDYFVQEKLIELRFFTDKCDKNSQDNKKQLDSVRERVKMTCDQISVLQAEYKEKGIDKKFLIQVRFVAQNIHILKRKVKSTYAKLPWEEMEFCMANFIAIHSDRKKSNLVYSLVLSKTALLKHMDNFSRALSQLDINELDIESKLPSSTNGNQLPRSYLIDLIVSANNSFQSLYDDYAKVKNYYSLKRIEAYLEIALSVSLKKEPELAKLVIERTLQVTGECLKNTQESPNVSDDLQNTLLVLAPRDLVGMITSLRNSLSHGYWWPNKVNMENSKEPPEFFEKIQNDLKKIEIVVREILYKKKIEAIKENMDGMTSNKDELKELANNLKLVHELEDLKDGNINELIRIEQLISTFSGLIKNQSPEEKDTFDQMIKIITSQKARVVETQFNIFKGLSNTGKLIAFEAENLTTVRGLYATYLDLISMQSQMQPELEEIVTLVSRICEKRSNTQWDEMHQIAYEIMYIINWEIDRVQAVSLFNEKLESKIEVNPDIIEKKVEDILTQIESYITDNKEKTKFKKKIDEAKEKYQPKKALYALFNKLIQNQTKPDDKDHEEYNKQVVKMKLNANKRKQLDTDFMINGNFAACKVTLDGLRSGYQDLLSKAKDLQNDPEDNIKTVSDWLSVESLSPNIPGNVTEEVESRLEILEAFSKSSDLKLIQQSVGNRKLVVALEMIVLELLEVFESKGLLNDNRLFLDEFTPLLVGKALRNYLAHGDAFVDILPFDTSNAIMSNASILKQETRNILKDKRKIGRFIPDQPGNVEKYCRALLDQLDKQIEQRSFNSVTQLEDLDRRFLQQFTKIFSEEKGYEKAENIGTVEKEIIKSLIEDQNKLREINAQKVELISPVKLAAAAGRNDILNFLSNSKIFDPIDESLMRTIDRSFEENMNILLQRSSLDAQDENQPTLLQLATLFNNQHLVSALLDNKAPVNATHGDCLSALHIATMNGDIATVEALINKGADVNLKDKQGSTPLHFAALSGNSDITELLLKHNSDVDAKNNEKCAPIHLAAMNGHEKVVNILLKHQADIDSKAEGDKTALHLAVDNQHNNVVKVLLEPQFKANVDAKSTGDWTPLHKAALDGNREIMEALLKCKANVNAKNVNQMTALHLAVNSGHKYAVDTLLKSDYRVDVNAGDNNNITPLHIAALNGSKEIAAALLDKNAEVNAQTNQKNTALHLAVLRNYEKIVTLLLERKADVDRKDDHDQTALYIAVKHGRKGIVQALLKYQAKVDVMDVFKFTPLHFAVENNDKEIVDMLLKHNANVNVYSARRWTPLHVACKNGHVSILETLLKQNADVEAKNELNETPLHVAVSCGHKKIVETLLNNNADVDVVDNNCFSLLHKAACNNLSEITVLLLDHHARVNSQDEQNLTPLHVAANLGHKEIVEFLLKHNADINARDKKDQTPLHLAAENNHLEVIRLLGRHSADMNARNKINLTPLHIALATGPKHTIRALLECKADVNVEYSDNKHTLLQLAVYRRDKEIVELLLEHGAHVDAQNSEKSTALHIAVNNGLSDIAQVIIKHGANVNMPNDQMLTPLHLAVLRCHKDIVEVLMKNGANPKAEDSNKYTPLFLAIELNYTEISEILLQDRTD